METRRLYKIDEGKKLMGVCGGFAEYLRVDPTVVRLIWVLFGLFYFTGVVAYFIAALVLPFKHDVI